MMTQGAVNWEQVFAKAARNFDWRLIAETAQGYADHLRSVASVEKSRQAKSILGLLRETRRYPELLLVADALLGQGIEDAAVRRQFAQALVDRNTPAAAALVFRALIDDPTISDNERAEAFGGLGRCYKQLYVMSEDVGLRARNLQLALAAYQQAYSQDPKRVWQGINVVALLAAAARERIGLPDFSDPARKARGLAALILQVIDETPDPDAWAKATAIEACVGLGETEETLERAVSFADDRAADSFKIASILRQLEEVWKLQTTDSPGDTLLPLLRSALLAQDGGTVSVADTDVRASLTGEMTEGHLERIFGPDRYNTLTWYRTGLDRCRAVGQVTDVNQVGVGTGFVMNGNDLHPALPDRVFVTNSHVVPEGLSSANAIVFFHGLDRESPTHGRRIVRLWWNDPSRSPGLDAAVLELDSIPDEIEPIPSAGQLPLLEGEVPARAYVIGHPRGLYQPQFSLQDNILLDYDSTLIHYRSPTEPGSSGSPVFDGQWGLIALHHSGAIDTPRLNHRGGSYAANEGIRVSAIIAGLRDRQPHPQPV